MRSLIRLFRVRPLAKVNQRAFKGTFRDEARRAIADLEQWERTNKNSPDALKAYLGSADRPLMAEEAQTAIAALLEAAERDACEAYAATATEQVGRAKALGCGVAGEKWSARKVVQINECVELQTADARAARTGERNAELTQCQNDKVEAEAWHKLQTVLGQKPQTKTNKAAKAKADATPPELEALREKIADLSSEIATINAFLASNPNKANGKFASEARAAIDGRTRQIEGLKAKVLETDRALWAKAEAAPNNAEGYKTYLATFPEGEHAKAEVEAILADIEVCEVARKADDVAAMKAYREKFAKGRCAEEFAKLIAPSTDLTGARLVVTDMLRTATDGQRNASKIQKAPPSIAGLVFNDFSRFLVVRDNAEFGEVNLANGMLKPSPQSYEVRWLEVAGKGIPSQGFPDDDSAYASIERSHLALYYAAGQRWMGVFPRVVRKNSSEITNGTSTFAWFEDGIIKVQEASPTTVLRSFAIKEKDATVPRIAMSADGKWLAAIIEWSETRPRKIGHKCLGEKGPYYPGGVCRLERREVRVFEVIVNKPPKVFSSHTLTRSVYKDADAAMSAPLELPEAEPSKIGPPTAVDFSPDGTRLFIGYADGKIETRSTTSLKVDELGAQVVGGYAVKRIHDLGENTLLVELTTRGYWKESFTERTKSRGAKGLDLLGGIDDTSSLPAREVSLFSKVHLTSRQEFQDATETSHFQNAIAKVNSYKDILARGVSPDKQFLAVMLRSGSESPGFICLWDIPSGRYLGGVELLPDGGYVTILPSGAFTASENAEPYLAVEIGKRRWPLADVPAFKKQFFRKDGISLLAPSP